MDFSNGRRPEIPIGEKYANKCRMNSNSFKMLKIDAEKSEIESCRRVAVMMRAHGHLDALEVSIQGKQSK
jgi:hypothetical protein